MDEEVGARQADRFEQNDYLIKLREVFIKFVTLISDDMRQSNKETVNGELRRHYPH